MALLGCNCVNFCVFNVPATDVIPKSPDALFRSKIADKKFNSTNLNRL